MAKGIISIGSFAVAQYPKLDPEAFLTLRTKVPFLP